MKPAALVLPLLEYVGVVLVLALETVVLALYVEWFVDWGPIGRKVRR